MRRFTLVLAIAVSGVLLLAFADRDEMPSVIRVSSRMCVISNRSVHVEWFASRALLAKQQQWDGLRSEVPLGAASASRIALEKVRRRFPDVTSWTVQAIHLRNLTKIGADGGDAYPGVWCYEIVVFPTDGTIKRRLLDLYCDHPFTQVLLLDGAILASRVVEAKPGTLRVGP